MCPLSSTPSGPTGGRLAAATLLQDGVGASSSTGKGRAAAQPVGPGVVIVPCACRGEARGLASCGSVRRGLVRGGSLVNSRAGSRP